MIKDKKKMSYNVVTNVNKIAASLAIGCIEGIGSYFVIMPSVASRKI